MLANPNKFHVAFHIRILRYVMDIESTAIPNYDQKLLVP